MFITTPADAYVLRISKQHSPEGMRYEHQVLTALAKMNLPFTVPVPLPTIDGATYVPLLPNSVACLVRRLPGAIRQGKNLQQALAAGEALGRLVCALGQIHLPRGQAHYPPYGDLGSYLPAGYTTCLLLITFIALIASICSSRIVLRGEEDGPAGASAQKVTVWHVALLPTRAKKRAT